MQPMFNFQGSAVLSILAFLGTGALLSALGGACVVMLARRKPVAAGRAGLAAAAVAGAYLLILVGTSLAARPRVVEPGNAKYFCEIDCHLAYSVAGSRRVAALGSARGTFEVVTLKVWFDPRTTSPRRDDSPLYPNPRAALLLDAEGHPFYRSGPGQAGFEAVEGRQPPLTQPLRPGESYTTSIVFDVAPESRASELLLTETDPVTHLLIGHENSLLHPRIPFRLTDSPPAARAEVRG